MSILELFMDESTMVLSYVNASGLSGLQNKHEMYSTRHCKVEVLVTAMMLSCPLNSVNVWAAHDVYGLQHNVYRFCTIDTETPNLHL